MIEFLLNFIKNNLIAIDDLSRDIIRLSKFKKNFIY